jgi:multiple sugar transport system permease protein
MTTRPIAIGANQTGGARTERRAVDWAGLSLTGLIALGALAWLFPIYWAVATSLTPEDDVVSKGLRIFPPNPTLGGYQDILEKSNIVIWYFNSVAIALVVTFATLAICVACAYALSQVDFPGRRYLFLILAASVMVPMEALVINHFVLMNAFGFINTWAGVILPQIVAPASVIIFKQFFDQIPKDYAEAARMDNAGHFKIFLRIYVPMNWGVITAIGITTFIACWNNFLWPFLVANTPSTMTVPVGVTQVHDLFGLHFARDMALAMLAALPVTVLYLIFQNRITQAIMLSAGIKG